MMPHLIDKISDRSTLGAITDYYRRRWSAGFAVPRGAHGESVEQFSGDDLDRNLSELSEKLRAGYRFSPMRERRVTAHGKARTVWQPMLTDLIVTKAMADVCGVALNPLFAPTAFAYRGGPEAPKIDDAIRITLAATRRPKLWAVKADIRNFFDSVPLGPLEESIRLALDPDHQAADLFCAYLRAPRLMDGRETAPLIGIPTGTPPSNLLSNVYLRTVDSSFEHLGDRYLRYCDDLLIFVESQSKAVEVLKQLAASLDGLGLALNEDKTLVSEPGSRFDFLGYEFSAGQPRIGRRAVARLKARFRALTRRQDIVRQQIEPSVLLQRVNELVEIVSTGGFAWYFRRAHLPAAFRELDTWIMFRVQAALSNRLGPKRNRTFSPGVLRKLGLRSLAQGLKARSRVRRRNQVDDELMESLSETD